MRDLNAEIQKKSDELDRQLQLTAAISRDLMRLMLERDGFESPHQYFRRDAGNRSCGE